MGQHRSKPSTRRGFLKTFAAGFAFPMLAPVHVLGRTGVAPSNRLSIGLVGLGRRGMQHLASLSQSRETPIVAVCDANFDLAQKTAREAAHHINGLGMRAWRDHREMFAEAALDAVIIATPDHWHAPMAIAAARAGLDVYGEAPLAHTLAEGRAIVDTMRLHGRIWQDGSLLRSLAPTRLAVELVRNGRLGKVTHVEVGAGNPPINLPTTAEKSKSTPGLDLEAWVGPAPWTEPVARLATDHSWQYVSAYGGGQLLALAAQSATIAQWGLNSDFTGPIKISATGTFLTTPPYDLEKRFRCVCTYEKGVVVAISPAFPAGVRFYGERGWLHVEGLFSGNPNQAPTLRASNNAILSETPRPEEERVYHSNDHWANFADCIKNRRDPISTAETAHRATSIGHLAHIAILTGRTLRWNPTTENILDDPGANALLQPANRAQA
ncbi:MAG: Gfo/Idh/MocA family oxidoreductase [Puniceicoccales bacterium]|jgi:predicted dehydrogenase|nr:Gfo/Idh/MocA family oxidoreductase [Puniceicoccales bacterium]